MRARFIVRFGALAFRYFTRYHAEQMRRALVLNGTPAEIEEG